MFAGDTSRTWHAVLDDGRAWDVCMLRGFEGRGLHLEHLQRGHETFWHDDERSPLGGKEEDGGILPRYDTTGWRLEELSPDGISGADLCLRLALFDGLGFTYIHS